jgi:hypothetical protein
MVIGYPRSLKNPTRTTHNTVYIDSHYPKGMSLQMLVSVIDIQSPYLIGQGYLALNPQEAKSQWLAETVFGSIPKQFFYRQNQRQLKVHLDQCIRQDFEKQRMCQVNGWVLARTEARLCALIALS